MAMRVVVVVGGAGAVRQWWWTGRATGSGRVAPRSPAICAFVICQCSAFMVSLSTLALFVFDEKQV
jgi:hypothetical protein